MAAFNYYQIGGMNRGLNPMLVNPSDLKLVRNYKTNVMFTKEKRNGYSLFLNDLGSERWNGLFFAQHPNGAKYIFGTYGNSLRYNQGLVSFVSNWLDYGSTVYADFGSTIHYKQILSSDASESERVLNAANDYIAGKFVPTSTTTIYSLRLLIKKTLSPDSDLTVEIQTDNSSKPSGTPVANGTIDSLTSLEGFVGTGFSWFTFTFATAPSVTSGTTYWIVVKPKNVTTLDGTNYYTLGGYIYDVSKLYMTSADAGTSWTNAAAGAGLAIVITSSSTTTRVSSVILNNTVLFANGSSRMSYYNFASLAVLTPTYALPAPSLAYLITLVGRVWGAGDVVAPSTLYFSAVNSATSWANNPVDASTGGSITIDPDNNGAIVGISARSGRIIVHKEGGRYKVLLDEDGLPSEVINMTNTEPAINHWSITSLGKYDYYINRTGVWRDDGSNPELISLPLGDLMRNVTDANLLDCAAGAFKDEVWFSVGDITEDFFNGGRTYSNVCFVYNIRSEEWAIYTFPVKPTCFVDFKTHAVYGGTENLYMGTNDGSVYRLDTSLADNTTPIEGELVWHPLHMGDPTASKTLYNIYVSSQPGVTSNLFAKTEDIQEKGLGDLQTGYDVFSLNEEFQNGKTLSLAIRDNSSTAISRILGFTVEAELGNRRDE